MEILIQLLSPIISGMSAAFFIRCLISKDRDNLERFHQFHFDRVERVWDRVRDMDKSLLLVEKKLGLDKNDEVDKS